MAEPAARRPQTKQRLGQDWSADQVMAYAQEQFAEVRRAVDVAREGEPPHVILQYHLEAILTEREKAVQLALESAEKLEQERIGRIRDSIEAERRIGILTRELSDTAILKAETAGEKRFEEFQKTVNSQLEAMRTALQDLTRRIDMGLGGGG